jgi:hypothetical protein
MSLPMSALGRKGGNQIIADNLHDAGWSLGWVSTIDSQGQTIWITDAHRGDGKRFIARADEILTAFVELESSMRKYADRHAANNCDILLCRISPHRVKQKKN